MSAAVVVLGSANLDLVVRQPRRAQPGETLFGTEFHTGPGGKGLNQAIAAARAGASVRFLGAVGADAFADRLRDRLVADGVDVAGLRTVPGSTGIAQISVTDDGENTIVIVPGANGSGEFTAADRAAVSAASHLVVQLERPRALLAQAMHHAREAGVTTVLTPAPARADLADLLSLTDLLVPNEGEARLLSGRDDAESAAIDLSRLAGTVVVTLGERGALVARGGEIVQRVAAHPARAVDTTAAGDTFVGVMVAWLAEGRALTEALDAAAAGAAITVTRQGAAESMPFRAEIDAAVSDVSSGSGSPDV